MSEEKKTTPVVADPVWEQLKNHIIETVKQGGSDKDSFSESIGLGADYLEENKERVKAVVDNDCDSKTELLVLIAEKSRNTMEFIQLLDIASFFRGRESHKMERMLGGMAGIGVAGEILRAMMQGMETGRTPSGSPKADSNE